MCGDPETMTKAIEHASTLAREYKERRIKVNKDKESRKEQKHEKNKNAKDPKPYKKHDEENGHKHCPHCHRFHMGECRMKSVVRFQYGKKRHFIKNYLEKYLEYQEKGEDKIGGHSTTGTRKGVLCPSGGVT